MKIDDIEYVKGLLANIENLFNDLDNVKAELEKQIRDKENETQDYLHELELGELNRIDIMKVSKALIKTRKDRRIYKDKLEVINTLKGYTDKYINKGIIAETRQTIKNLETLEHYWETRVYKSKVIENLKCSKAG